MTNAVAFSWLNMLTTPLEPVKTTKDSAAKAPARAPRPMQKPIEFKRRVATRICNQMYGQSTAPEESDIIERLREEAMMPPRVAKAFLHDYKTEHKM